MTQSNRRNQRINRRQLASPFTQRNLKIGSSNRIGFIGNILREQRVHSFPLGAIRRRTRSDANAKQCFGYHRNANTKAVALFHLLEYAEPQRMPWRKER